MCDEIPRHSPSDAVVTTAQKWRFPHNDVANPALCKLLDIAITYRVPPPK